MEFNPILQAAPLLGESKENYKKTKTIQININQKN